MKAIKPQLASGTRDFNQLDMIKRRYVISILERLFKKYSFFEISTPAIENTSTLTGNYGGDGDKLIFNILNSGNYLSKVNDSVSLKNYENITKVISKKALRYDLSVPLARYVALNRNDITFPFKRYQIQPVWRADRPQKGRFREFYQCDIDVIGSESIVSEIEMINIIFDFFNEIKFKNFRVRINSRSIMNSFFGLLKLKNYDDILVILDKKDKVGLEQVVEEIKKLNIEKSSIDIILRLLYLDDKEVLSELCDLGLKSSVQETKNILDMCLTSGLSENVCYDFSLVRGLGYYTGFIVEVDIIDSDFGSVVGGGRYDNLTSVFGLKDVSGIGISFGLERIMILMEENNLFPKDLDKSINYLFLNFGDEYISDYIGLASKLRSKNKVVEIYSKSNSIKKQMIYANKKNVDFVVIFGENEKKSQKILIKNMKTGSQEDIPLDKILNFIQ
ncbi:MAG: histidine--tRNA ligase [Flavobacteriales bacterium]|nr:histidine--tRNA ligase [Flavobacteriales bacterium]|tara:strand:+ start:309 stop:1649 length:1341 start_codon:yes stop_codon:yes gene_type:complete